MSMIRVENLTFAYPSSYDNIFENVNFQIDTDWKLGFIGRNGRGKTTFLNLLLGKYEYHGKIQASVQFDYFPYPVSNKNRLTADILSEVCPLAEEWELLRELSYLEVRDDVLWRPFFTLSNGEQTKVLLAALFLNDGHFLLIDEPTNHLDMKARETVSAYLKRKKGFILVSHDRCFLDGCVDHILSINRSNIEVQSGNFSTWFTNFQRQQEFELAQNVKLKKSIDNLQKAAQRTSVWSDRIEASKYGNGPVDRGYIGHKSAKMMKRSKAIEVRQQRAIEEKSGLLKNLETVEDLKIAPLLYFSDTLVTFSDVVPIFDGKDVIYAVGEPETSQHPDAQKMIVNTFREMTEKNGCQIILTTHVPGLAGLLPIQSLRYVSNGEGYPEVAMGTDDDGILKRIADTLGVLPDLTPPLAPRHYNVKLVICVEGPNDVAFLKAISQIAHRAYPDIIDLNMSPLTVVIPLGGGALKEWVNHNYLQKLGTPEYHIYDGDNTHAHASICDKVNKRGDGSTARETEKREMENYIHSDVVRDLFGIEIEINDTMDVSTEISTLLRQSNPEGPRPDTVKKKLNRDGVKKMTIDLLRSRDPKDEVLGWLREISAFVQK